MGSNPAEGSEADSASGHRRQTQEQHMEGLQTAVDTDGARYEFVFFLLLRFTLKFSLLKRPAIATHLLAN